jgi:hypothetical protein
MDIELHRVDDYEALYINGELVEENSSGVVERFFFNSELRTPITIQNIKSFYHGGQVSEHIVEERGSFPKTLSEMNEIIQKY